MIEKVKLDFMVDPNFLVEHTEVPDAMLIKIVDPEAIFLMGILGESGRKMILAGARFWFTRRLAEKLVNKGIAEWA